MARTLLANLDYVLTVDPRDTVLEDAAIVVEDDRIAAIGPSAAIEQQFRGVPFERVVDGRRALAMPGFVDAHLHLSEELSGSLLPDNLSTRAWVFNWAKPYYAAVNEEDEYVSALWAGIEMIKTGTTCFLDMGAQNDPRSFALAVERLGLRGITGRHAADRKPAEIPPYWTEAMVRHHFFDSADEALRVLREDVERWNGHAGGRLRCWVNIEGKEPCSPELHAGARRLAEQLGVGTTYHTASSIEEARVTEKNYGVWPVTRLHQIGALGPNLVLAHCTAVRDEEVALLAASGTKVAFCPGTALKIAKGATAIGKYPEMLDAGVTVALGCDGASAAGSLDMLKQMYLVAGLFKDARLNANLVPAVKAIRLATIDGARALLWDDEIGSLEVGKKADLILFDLDQVEWVPLHDPIQGLVYGASSASTKLTMVDGRVLMEDRRVLTVDEPVVREEVRRRAKEIVARAGLRREAIPSTTTLYD
jgi:5-methylthioadenosine/S-adenosylhomocysteine deaminase